MIDYPELVQRLRERIRDLEDENTQLRREYESADFRIRTELEPRIQAEGRRYDTWATNPERGM